MFGKNIVIVPEETLEQRRSLCNQCEFKKDSKPAKCRKCGCAINIKTLFTWQKCPIDKW